MVETTKLRTITKSIVWRIFATLITFSMISFILPLFQALAAAAMITAVVDGGVKFVAYYAYESIWAKLDFGKKVDKSEGCVIWLTGFSCAGKTTIAIELEKRLEKRLKRVEYLDGDICRKSMCQDLGFTKADRDENIKRISLVSSYLSKKAITICAFISPYREARAKAKAICTNFIEVYVDCPIDICEERDVKGMYAKARAGEIKGFTGIDDPYEIPEEPDIHLFTDVESVTESVDYIIWYLKDKGHI